MSQHHQGTEAPPAGPTAMGRRAAHSASLAAAVVALAATAAACTGDAPEGPETAHIPVDTIGTVGTLDGGDDGLLFGFISQVLPWGDTALVVADGIAGHLYLAGIHGEALGVHDRIGEGPGELQAPAGLGRGADGELVVWDLRLRRILRFDLSDGAFRHVGSVRTEASGRSVCTVEGRTFLGAPLQGSVVREVDPEAGSQRWVVDPERGRHVPISVLPWDDETLLVQLNHQRPVQHEDGESTSYETSTETLFVATADGALLGRLADFPAVRAGGEGRFFAVEMSPVPRVLVLEVAAGGGQ